MGHNLSINKGESAHLEACQAAAQITSSPKPACWNILPRPAGRGKFAEFYGDDIVKLKAGNFLWVSRGLFIGGRKQDGGGQPGQGGSNLHPRLP